jgi:RHS repeat-associated protein
VNRKLFTTRESNISVDHLMASSNFALSWLFSCLIFITSLCQANLQTQSPQTHHIGFAGFMVPQSSREDEKLAEAPGQSNSTARIHPLALLEFAATWFPRRSGDQMMAETNTIGNSLSQVTSVGSLLLGEVRGGVAQHFDQDAFNSVIVTSLADGTIPGRLSYRAFGAVRTTTGLINSPFRFNGYIDDGNGELSSPARYYASALGRFTGMDPAAMDPMNPMTLNPYLGLNGNPMVIVDPTGKRGESGHYYTTYYVGLRHGYDNRVAQKFAFYSQLPDEVDSLDAIGVKAVATWYDVAAATMALLPFGNNILYTAQQSANMHAEEVAKVGHSLTGRSGAVELQMTINALQLAGEDIGTSGILGHRFSDTDAHRVLPHDYPGDIEPQFDTKTYDLGGFGHVLDGHTPDVIQRTPDNYLKNVRVLSLWMSRKRGETPAQADKLAEKRRSPRLQLGG